MTDKGLVVDLSEVDALAADLDRIPNRIGADAAAAVRDAGQSIVKTARGRVPVDTGNLQRSLEVLNTDGDGRSARMTVTVGSRLSYSRFVEDGTAFQRPRPYLQPALETAAAELQQRLAEIVGQGI